MAFVAAMNTTVTENNALAYKSTQNPFLDLFFQLVRTTTPEQIKTMVDKIKINGKFSYNGIDYSNSDFFNRMIFYTRNIRGGVGERDIAYYMFMIIASDTSNRDSISKLLPHFSHFGFWKDYMNLIKIIKEDTMFGINDEYKSVLINKIITLCCYQLMDDLSKISSTDDDKIPSISLAAKWMPSDRDSFDKKYHILDKMAFKMASIMGWDVKENTKTYYIRGMFRKQVISPLRKTIKLVESQMCMKEWSNIDYEKVPSKAMTKYTKAFNKNDKERFEEYKAGLSSGEKKVNFEAVYPHEILKDYFSYGTVINEVAEAQMDGWYNKLKDMGKFGKAVSVVDVSGSMNGEPMIVAISLGMLISSVADEPFNNTVITFSESPSFYNLTGKSWHSRLNELSKAPWGMNTNFSKVFNLILDRALITNLKQDDMPERIYVFSDMQFDEADSGYHTHYESIKKKYENAGYALPQLVFWNLRSSSTNPNYPANLLNTNVALLSGFSPSIIKAVLNVSDLSPMAVMINAIMDPAYDIVSENM